MALAVSNLTSGSTASSSTTYTTASISPTTGDLILVAVKATSVTPAAFSKVGPPTITGAGLAFKLAASFGHASITRRLYLFWANADASATAGALTITYPIAPQNDCGWSIEKITGHDASSSIAWCVQLGVEATGTTSVHNPTLTLNALQNANSVSYGACYSGLSAAQWSAGSGFTQLSEQAAILATEYKVNDAVVTWGNTGTSTLDIILAAEITAANTGASNNPLANHFLGCSGAGS